VAELTPMMKQYLAIKEQHKDKVLFFRLGDFYEMFYDDAKLASKELEITLTGKDCGQEERAPMCGIPYHSCEGYIARLVAKGYKVAICEQTESPALAKGLVKREIVRIITPGTVIEGSMLDESKNNFICGLYVKGKTAGICFADISTGEVHFTQLAAQDIETRINNELGRFSPSEVIINGEAEKLRSVKAFLSERIRCTADCLADECFCVLPEALRTQFKKEMPQQDLENRQEAVMALCGLLCYLKETQFTGLERLSSLYYYSEEQYMKLDLATRRNLELVETMRSKEKRGTLLWVLDRTKTAMGKRLIRSYIEQPLLNPAEIVRRLNAVEEIFGESLLRSELCEALDGIYDLERLMTRIVYGTSNGRELRSLSQTIERLPEIKEKLKFTHAQLLCEINSGIDLLSDISELINEAIVEDPPVSVKDGGIVKHGYNKQVDELHEIMQGGKGFLAKIEAQEKERSGIRNLRIGYNRVFGYYIEITKSNIEQVPENYIRKQTLSNCERYITPELKELESRVLSAQEQIFELEFEIFDDIRKKVAQQLHRIQSTAKALAQLDVICSFAETAVRGGYCRPDIALDGSIVIKDGKHPVVEAILTGVPFVPNDTNLDQNENRVAIITGPNMAGKSTYMRQVALITLMAQIGSFVPAASAKISIVDSIFTRVGASDDLASGQSTFMVEMTEVAAILKNATARSLIVLDEIGRGTSTFDGMSIARAVVEYVCDKKRLGAKTLFATHYHELTELEELTEGIKNYNVAVKKHGDDITFLRRIIRGGADDSYGIEVAKLAGVPDKVVARAKEILRQLEAGQPVNTRRTNIRKIQPPQSEQLSMIDEKSSAILEKLRAIDANVLSPIEAMNILYELCHIAKREGNN